MMNKPELKNIQTNMVDHRKKETIGIIYRALEDEKNYIYPQCLCRTIKEQCDKTGGTWNCHVGPSFGSSFPYNSNTYFYAECDDLSILLYKFQ
ncbi:unnamed protein product [Mesocestoides corti]|uniref:Dynein light chain n=1 Tax=Mesocestoides corti TaxID=53468 RepID=A0A0R3UA14_MESCO|nr:unnamed protein product [Mesocestoides corti]